MSDALVGAQLPGLALDFMRLEVARGHDGLLRGVPEPVVIVGVYLAPKSGVRLVNRAIVRTHRVTEIPGHVDPHERRVARIRMGDADAGPVALVLLGVEEDDGQDVGRVYGALERPDAFTFWSEHAHGQGPEPIAELLARAQAVEHPRALTAWLDGHRAEDACKNDDWVGASIALLPRGVHAHTDMRFHLVSSDQRNDWTARVRVRYRAP